MHRRPSKMSFTMLLQTSKTRRINRIMFRLMSTTSTALVPTEPVPGDCGRWNSKTAKSTTATAVAMMINPPSRRARDQAAAAGAGARWDGPGRGSGEDGDRGGGREGGPGGAQTPKKT